MRKMSSVCDYFVIASGTSTTQVRAIADNIARQLKEKGERVRHMEGVREALWILIDCSDVVCHVFLEQTRRFYDLERLWADAPQTRFKEVRLKTHPKARIKARSEKRKKASRAAGRTKKNKTAKRRDHRKRR